MAVIRKITNLKIASRYEIWGLLKMSLSREDEYYGKGDNYWTGPVWINMKYIVLSSLHSHYITLTRDEYQAIRLKNICNKLRTYLITNML